MVAITRLETTFYNHSKDVAVSMARGENLKRLSIRPLVRIRVGAHFFGMVLAFIKGDPTDQWKRWSGARTDGERFPPLVCPRLPRPCRGTARVVEGLPRPSTCSIAGPLRWRAPGRRFSHPPHAYNASQRTSLRSPLLPRGGLLFFSSDQVKSPRSHASRGNARWYAERPIPRQDAERLPLAFPRGARERG